MRKFSVLLIIAIMLIALVNCNRNTSEQNVIRNARVIDIVYPPCRSGRVISYMKVSTEDLTGVHDTVYIECIEGYDHMLGKDHINNFYYSIENLKGLVSDRTINLPSAKVVSKIEPVKRNAILQFLTREEK